MPSPLQKPNKLLRRLPRLPVIPFYFSTEYHCMGLYDREYGRERTPWDRIENPRSITTILIVINVAIWVICLLLSGSNTGRQNDLTGLLGCDGDTLLRPWMWWQWISYGFTHDLSSPWHLAFNMLGLFIFGRPIENKLGRFEYLRVYLVAIAFSGIATSLMSVVTGSPQVTVGASGAVLAVTILFACYYPNERIYLFFVLAMPAWVLAMLFAGYNVAGSLGDLVGYPVFGKSRTAFAAHLGGILFGAAYFYRKWNLEFLAPGGWDDLRAKLRHRARKAKLKLHDPDAKLERTAAEADRILEKIHQHGESSLTSAERKTLELYSRLQRARRDQKK
jgi:membrane associated rhomboid family serine protease